MGLVSTSHLQKVGEGKKSINVKRSGVSIYMERGDL